MTPNTKGTRNTTRLLSNRRIKQYHDAMETAAREQDVEKAIENATTSLLRDGLEALHPDSTITLTYPHGTDGLITVRAPDNSLFSLSDEIHDVSIDTPIQRGGETFRGS